MTTYLVGVDEAGRGPLAGPVAVGVAVVPLDFDWSLLPGVGDSKQIKPKDREAILKQALQLRQKGLIDLTVAQTSATVIDAIGIVPAVHRAIQSCFKKLNLDPHACIVRLDGGLKAPAIFTDQATIIKGDAREAVIGLASIAAKVTRDRHMERLGQKPAFAPYCFGLHKGYGTKLHRELIGRHGLSTIHRRSFCRAFQT